ncbi:pilus assembly protein [Luteimonas suaedae]|uniref:pilus assembly protein n=1 Tax=Luteimonas suaedae TaxID=2605430 RepID=UPI0011EF1C92|nr:PilC/PilY family type IV pilus protein [Luteimonas suaedae]
MASRRFKLISFAALATAGVVGYFLYSVFAAQAVGTLAQAPLNVVNSTPPALIMAVDDSGSMDFETLLPTNDGAAWWDAGRDTFIGLNQNDAASAGTLNFNRAGGSNNDRWKKYVYLFPFGGGADGKANVDNVNDHFAIPPTPVYGWARSPDVNLAYFDPLTIYDPWIESDGSPLQGVAGIDDTTGQVIATSAPADPKRGTTRLDLTNDFRYDVDNGVFVFHQGMVVPAGAVYRSRGCDNGGAIERSWEDPLSGGWSTAQANRRITGNDGRSRCRVAIRYYPATFYVLESRAAAVAASIGYSATPQVDGAQTPDGRALARFEIRSANFVAGAYDAAIKNFANWFSYYRKRHAATRGGISLAFGKSRDAIRVGYFTINNRVNVVMRDMTDRSATGDRKLLFDSIFALRGSGGTPNKEAVAHMGEQFKRGREAGGAQPIRLACQKNYGMLFTDGFSNNSTTSVTANVDGTGAVPFVHTVFGDRMSGTMADIAAHYYTQRLGPTDLPRGKVPVSKQCSDPNPDPRLDCQTDPHMNFYGITLNGRGLQYDVNEPATRDPYTNIPAWPTAFFDRHPSAIDDIWHGTINARGAFYNARKPDDIAKAIEQVLNAVISPEGASGSIALTGARINANSLVVEPSYGVDNDGTDWYGKLHASRASIDPTTRDVTFTSLWEASNRMPGPTARANQTWFAEMPASGVVPNVRRFNASNLAGRPFEALCNNALARCTPDLVDALGVTEEEAVSYLLGDDSLEARFGGTKKLRDRETVLGDIINSSPVVSAPKDDYGYRSLPAPYGGAAYNDYLARTGADYKTGRDPMVYVGANDGMLHAFNGDTGRQEFAYIPATAVGHMGNLLFPYRVEDRDAQVFQHRYYVDGPISVSDAYYDGNWETVLVGTAGAGGRGVFALNVSNPGGFDQNDVLWEVNDQVQDASIANNIGYVLGKPVIVPVRTGHGSGPVRWKAIFGNGYNSVNGRAVLFVVDITDSGNPEVTMVEAVESGAPDGRNGLGNVLVLDRWGPNPLDSGNLNLQVRDGFADTVYAADQKGAIWKFDLRSESPSDQAVPLFTTFRYVTGPESGTRQPIVGGLTAAAGPRGGVMIYFGTGSFSFDGDQDDATMQSLYAVLDVGTGEPAAPLTRGDLLQQTITATVEQRLEGEMYEVRTTSSNRMIGLRSGWYLDLPAGERFVGYPRIEQGVVFMPTYDPNASAGECTTNGSNWLYGLNALSGAAALQDVRIGSVTGDSPSGATGALGLKTDSTAPVKDVAVLSTARVSPLDDSATEDDLKDALAAQCSMVVQVAGAPPLVLPRACGRQSWRQIQ